MAIDSWGGGSGDWGAASLWSAGTVASGPTTTADISTAGSYLVTIDTGESFAVGGATLDNAAAALLINYDGADLDLSGGTFDLAMGTLAIAGILSDGTLDVNGGSVSALSGTLDDMTVVGPLDLTTPYAVLTIADSFAITGASAGQQGTIDVTGAGIGFAGTDVTLSNTLLELGSATDTYYSGQLRLAGTLDIDARSTVAILGAQSGIVMQAQSESALVNEGVFELAGTRQFLNAIFDAFDNTGTFILGASDTMSLTLTNQQFGELSPPGSFANTGTIILAAGALLAIDGELDAASLGTIVNEGGTLLLNGTLDNTGNTLTFSAGGSLADFVLEGTLAGGTLDPAGGVVQFAGGTLAGVAFASNTLTVADGQSVTIVDGVTLAPGSGTLVVGGALLFGDTETLDGDAIQLSGQIGSTGGSLVLGADTVIVASGNAALTGPIVDPGLIEVTGGTLQEDFSAASPAGTIDVFYGATLVAEGAYSAASFGTLSVGGVLALAGTIANTGATLDIRPGTNFADVTLTGTLAGGVLALDGGTLTTVGGATLDGVTVRGPLVLSGGSEALGIMGGLTLTGTDGSSPGTLIMTGAGDSLSFADAELLQNLTLQFGNAQGAYQAPYSNSIDFGPTLTIGSNALLEAVGTQQGAGLAPAAADLEGAQVSTLVNDGTIAVFGSLTRLSLSASSFENAGTYLIGAGATLAIGVPYPGTLDLSTLGTVLNQGGLLEIDGIVDNTGRTIDIAPSTAFSNVLFDYELDGGVVQLDGGTLGLEGYDSDVTFEGAVTLGGTHQDISLSNVTFTGAGGVGPGTLFVDGPSVSLSLGPISYTDPESQTLDDATIYVGSPQGGSESFNVSYGGTVTFGPNLVIDAVGTGGLSQFTGQGSFVNEGTILVGGSGDVLAIAPLLPGSFINDGTIILAPGGTLAETVHGTIGGFGSLVLDGGALEVLGTVANAGSTLDLVPGSLLGNLILGGTIVGGTIRDDGGTLIYARGTLAGVTTLGTLDLATQTSTLTVTGGVDVTGTAGGDGLIAVTGTGSTLILGDTETLDDVLIRIGNASGFNGPEALLLADAGLTLDAGATLVDDVAGGKADLEFATYYGSITNAGTIIVSGAGAVLTLAPQDYNANYLQPNPDFINSGTVVIGPDATFSLVDVANIATLGSIINQGTLALTGTYSNSGTYSLLSGATLLLDGTLAGGTVDASSGALQLGNATLDDVVLTVPTLTLTPLSGAVDFLGTTALSAPGGGPTVLVAEAGFGHLSLAANYTLDNVLLTYGTTGLTTDILAGSYAVATLGAATTLDVAGTGNELYLVGQFDLEQPTDFDPGTIVNRGTILVGAGAELVDEVSSFANLGTIALASGADVALGIYTSLSATDLGDVVGSGATFALGGTYGLGGGTLDLSGGGPFSDLNLTGTLMGGTLLTQGGTFAPSLNANLSNMTVDGGITLNGSTSFLAVVGSLALHAADGTDPGTLAITAGGAEIDFIGAQTFDNAVVILSGGIGTFGSVLQFPGIVSSGTATGNSGSLTLGAHLLVTTPADGGALGGSGTLVNDGTIAVGDDATMYVTPYGTLAGPSLFTNAGTIVIGSNGTLVIDTEFTTGDIGTVVTTAGTLALAGDLDNTNATLAATAGLPTLALGAAAEGGGFTNGLVVSGGAVLADGGRILLTGNDSLDEVDYIGGLFVGAGTDLNLYRSTVSALDGGAPTITLAGDLYTSQSTLTGATIALVSTLAQLEIDLLDAAGSLAPFSTTLEGFSAGDKISLELFAAGQTITGVTYDGTDLVAFDGATQAATFLVGGGYNPDDFVLTPTGYGVYDITTTDTVPQPAPCYAPGTSIATPGGARLVEHLAVGDEVLTASGVARPISWIGRRSYDGRFIAGNRDILPIVFRAGSLSDGIPARDLTVSPKHAMLLDGVLIPAELLVNGRSIIQLERVDQLTYYHIELDAHDILLAEGAPSESFIDHDSRLMFQNAAEFLLLHPQPPAKEDCAPRVEDGDILARARRRIAGRAGLVADHADDAGCDGPLDGRIDSLDAQGISGWAFDATRPGTAVQLEICEGERVIGTVVANRFRLDLRQARLGDGRCAYAFRFDVPPADLRAVSMRRVSEGQGASPPGPPPKQSFGNVHSLGASSAYA